MSELNDKALATPKAGFSAVSKDELDRIDGGFLPIVYGLACAAGALGGYIATSRALEGTGTLRGLSK